MKDQILEQIHSGKREGIKLFLHGLEHTLVRRYLSLEEVVQTLEPDLILFEGHTPQSTYQNGVGTGDFEEVVNELLNPKNDFKYWQSPSLVEVKNVVDSLGCLVAGMDLPLAQRKVLERKHKLKYQRIAAIYEGLMQKSARLLEETPEKLSVAEYQEMEQFQDELKQRIVLHSDEDNVNEVGKNYDHISAVVNRHPKLQGFMKSAYQKLSSLGNDLRRWSEERDSVISKAILDQYDEKKVILVCIGGAHLEEGSPLLDYLGSIKTVKFYNYHQERY